MPGPEFSLSDSEYRLLLSMDFQAFAARAFQDLHPQTRFLPSPYLDVIASRLEDCRRGRIRRLIINIPPRHTKSILTSVALPAWLLGHDPGLGIICASYGQDLADGFARQCRGLMTSSWYGAVFPTRLNRNAVQDFATTRKGFRFATSVGGVLTGRGADVIILDDPMKPDEALSAARRSAVNEWFDNTLLSRLNSQEAGVIIIVMQRLHMDDLVGHVREKGGWEVLSLPAIAEEDEHIPYETLLGPKVFKRRTGEALHPARFSAESLQELRRVTGPYNFAAQYQQNPIPLEGNLVKRSWLQSYKAHELKGLWKVQSWDTANKAGELNDYSVCTTWGVRDRRYYLLDVYRRRLEFPELKRAVRDLAAQHQPRAILIEDKASGTQLIQDLKRENLHGVTAVQPPAGTDKVMRLHMHTATFENGRVLLPEEALWLDAYVAELTGFPGVKHDDQVDSTTQTLSFLDAYRPPMVIPQALLDRLEAENRQMRRRRGY